MAMKSIVQQYRGGITLLVVLVMYGFAALMMNRPADAQIYSRVGSLGQGFNCTIISTATALTEVTGCSAPTAGSRYITDISWSSSIISTTTNYMLIRSGTGADCGSATASLWAGFSLAFTHNAVHFTTPIKATALHAICFVHPGTGTRNVNIQGFLQ